MNGRTYDYNLGRFLSVDPVIQAPANSQSLNPYSYIMNNPLSGTDPTGYTIDCAGGTNCSVTVDEINSIGVAENGTITISTDGGTFEVSNDQAAKALVAIISGAEGSPTTDSGVNISGLGSSEGRASMQDLVGILGDTFEGRMTVGTASGVGGSGGSIGRATGSGSCTGPAAQACFVGRLADALFAGTGHTFAPLTSLFRDDDHVVNAYTGEILTPDEAFVAKVSLLAEVVSGAMTGVMQLYKFSDDAMDAATDLISITTPYKRPNNATTPAQRASVQGKPCVDCGVTADVQVADHIDPLVVEFYRTGTIDIGRARSLDAVQPQCPLCSARQGGELSKFSREKKSELGLNDN